MPATPAKPVPAKPKPTGWDRPLAEINAVIRKAEAGDPTALDEVKGMMTRPGMADLLGGNVAKEALRAMVARYAGNNPVVRETVARKLNDLRAELSGENPTPLERLLIDRVLATWLHLYQVESNFAGRESTPIDLAGYFQKAITAAQKRYLAAIKGLADVRKLALPALQVNIARKQVNVANISGTQGPGT